MPEPTSKNFSGIFISYRRDDSSGHAGRLFDRLADRFGKEHVFMDIDHIAPGEDFVEVIEDVVGSCDILIAVIGQNWHSTRDELNRLMDDPNDFVRLEIKAALERKIRVIPVLVQGAHMPRAQQLPEELGPLARRNAHELSDLRWNHDVEQLITALEGAQAKRAAEAKQEKINTLCRDAGVAVAGKDWAGAIAALNQVLVLDPTHTGASEMLADAQKRSQLSDIYKAGLVYQQAGRWTEALSSLKQIQSEVPDYEDVSALIETAQRGLDKEEAEARRRDAEEVARLKLATEQEAARRAEEERVRLKRERERELEQAAIRREAERKAESARVAEEARQRERKREQQELKKKEDQARAAAALQKEEEAARQVAERNRLKGEEEARSRAIAEVVRREREQKELKKKGKLRPPTGIKATVLQQNREQVRRLVERNPLKTEGGLLSDADAYPKPREFQSLTNLAAASGTIANAATDQERTKIKTSWGCTLTLLTLGIAICGLAVYIFHIASFTSTLSTWLYILTISSVGIVGFVALIGGIGTYFVSGSAPCPKCGEKVDDLEPGGSNNEILCKKCHTYLEGSDHWLWQTPDYSLSSYPVFSTQLTKKPIFPKKCCVCGKPETRKEKLAYSAKYSLPSQKEKREIVVEVPHCSEDSNGAALAVFDKGPFIKFRSLSYLKDYCKLNGTVPERGY